MNLYETLGMGWVIFTSALAHVAIIYGAYKHYQRMLADAKDAASVREMVR